MTKKSNRQKDPKCFNGKKPLSYSEIQKRSRPLQDVIDEFHRDSDMVFSFVNPKEQNRLIDLIQSFIRNNQHKDIWIFPTQIYNMENLMAAAKTVKVLPEFSLYYYAFSTTFNLDKSMGALYISRDSFDPDSLKEHKPILINK